jgi:GNAT superfamily N-acetyltransferase
MIGVVTDGFDKKPYTYQDYSPPRIARLLDALGFERFYPMRTFEIDVQACSADALIGPHQRSLLADRDWRFAPVTRSNLSGQLRVACGVLNDSFADNPMFVPLSEEEFLFPCAGMTWVIDETLSSIAYHREEPVGVLLAIPDLQPVLHASRYRIGWKTPWLLWRSRHRRERAAVIFYAVRRDRHGLGVNGVMLQRLIEAMRAGGYRTLGISWIGDGNAASLRQMEKTGARPLHRLHLFRKALL